jgi:hypothetical protein
MSGVRPDHAVDGFDPVAGRRHQPVPRVYMRRTRINVMRRIIGSSLATVCAAAHILREALRLR